MNLNTAFVTGATGLLGKQPRARTAWPRRGRQGARPFAGKSGSRAIRRPGRRGAAGW
ncbi:hypothetical protein ACU4GD_07385 [Cupriavidus basilensis]